MVSDPSFPNTLSSLKTLWAGVIKIIADKRYGEILGIHIMAPSAVDLINVAAVAMLSEATVDKLMQLIPMHPALGEAMVTLRWTWRNGRCICLTNT